MSLTYYLLVDGIDGGSQAEGHEGWFEISSYDFTVLQHLASGSGSGAEAGEVEFSPLTVDLALGSGLTDLLAKAAGGLHLAGIKIEGVTAGEQSETVFELTLGDVLITQVQEGSGSPDHLAFEYRRFWVETTAQDPDGTLGATESFGYDLALHTPINNSGQPNLSVGDNASAGGASKYYLLVDGIDGGSQAEGHEGWFEISSYDFTVLQHLASGSGSGAEAGEVEFSPLTVDLALGSGLTDLLAKAAGGLHLAGIKIEGVTAGEQSETVFELTLGDVLITQVQEGSGSPDHLAFEYRRFWVETTAQDPDGTLGATESFGYDLALHTPINNSGQPNLSVGDNASAGGASKYYLLVDGIDGGSQAEGHEGWFEISSYDFTVLQHLASGSGSGAEAGEVEFSPLTVDLALGSGLTDLLAKAAGGLHLAGIKIEGVTAGEQSETVFELTLGDVLITQVQEGSGSPDHLAFEYRRFWVETTAQDPDGTLGATESFGYDLALHTPINNSGQPNLSVGDNASAGGASKYYLLVDGIDGGSQAEGHEGWFEISSYDFTVLQHLASGSGSGAEAGEVEFSPLTVDLALGSGLTDLLAKAAGGLHLAGIKIEGVTAGEQSETVFELTLGDVLITQVQEGSGSPDHLAFEYRRFWVETTAQDPDGTLGATESFGYDLALHTPINNSGQPNLSVGDNASAGGASKYYLLVDGIDGGSQAEGHEGWFEISSYDFTVLQHLASGSGSGAEAGEVEFSPLTVDLALGSGLTDLLAKAAGGLHLAGIKIEGVTAGEQSETVFELTLGDVLITQVQEGSGSPDHLAFEYRRFWVETTAQDPDGTLGATESFGYDLALHTPINNSGQPNLSVGDNASAGGASKYYLLVDGIDGGSQAEGHEGWFEISSYDFTVLQHLASGSGSGAEAGEVEFSPLTVDLALGSGLTDLLAKAAGGLHLAGIKIEGVTAGEQSETVFELTLGDVLITQVQEGSGSPDHLAFEYRRFWVETTAQDPDGTLGATESFGYDLALHTPINNSGQPNLSVGDNASAGGASKYYLLVDGIDGGSQAEGHEGWFEISSYDFTVLQHLASGSGSGAEAGEVEFSPLTVDLALGSGLTDLLAKAAGGLHLAGIKIEGVTAGEQSETVFELTLGDVLITQVQEGSGSPDHLAFEYRRFWVETTAQDPDGTLGATESFGYDLALHTPINNSGQPNLSVGDNASAGGASKYYLLVDGIDGGSQAEGHEGWFEISSYDFTVLQHLASGSGSGAEAGEVEFSPLTVDLALGSGLTDLLAKAAGGLHLAGIKIEGVTAGEQSETVFELTLGDVLITQVQEGSGSPDHLAFEYRRFWVETTAQDPDGTLGATESFGYDLASNSPIDPSGEIGQPVSGQYGEFTLYADGSYSYVADSLASAPVGEHVHDEFTYTVGDGYGGTDSAIVDIVLNRPPTLMDDNAVLQFGKQLVVDADNNGVLSNDLDADGDFLSIASISGGDLGSPVSGQYGSLTLHVDGGYTYISNVPLGAAGIGFDVFTYQVDDGYGGTISSSLTITIFSGQQNYISGTPGDDVLFTSPSGNGKAPLGNGKSILSAGAGNDTILGGNGPDILIGGSGDNSLTGGRGPDTFIFDAGSSGHNIVFDFKLGVDHVEFINTAVVNTHELDGSTVLELSNGGDITLIGITQIDSWEVLV